MFTGLIEGIGKISGIRRTHNEMKVTITPLFDTTDCQLGDSVAVNGVCLTVTEVRDDSLSMDVSGETLSRTTLGLLRLGDHVNIERALRLTDRLGGHLVSGHVDGIGKILKKEQVHQSWLIRIGIEEAISRYTINKGSIAVEGISLTINTCEKDFFEVNIIPQTGMVTTLLTKKIGDPVNIETDLIGKYVEKLFSKGGGRQEERKASGIDFETLAKHGFDK
ncbi:MAG: riboflavin synthase [Desulfobacteraceae bacterium]|nr:riboflavin synthase [Desulfobacteraceae bacterium]